MAIDLDQAVEVLSMAELAAVERSRKLTAEGQAKLLQLSTRCVGTKVSTREGLRFELDAGGLQILSAQIPVASWQVHNANLQLRQSGSDQISYSTGDVDDAVMKTAEVVRGVLKKTSHAVPTPIFGYARSA